MSLSLLAFLFIGKCWSAKKSWDYDSAGHNISHWVELYPECGGDFQSPIDITGDGDDCTEPLILNWTSETTHFGLRNSGHTLHALPFSIAHNGGGDLNGLQILHHTNDTNIRLQNAFYNTFKSPVNEEYCFDSLHFHWGTTNADGSEHTVDGVHFPLEMHLVHYSCDYYMIGNALEAFVGGEVGAYDDHHILGVIGILFELGDTPNPVLDKILSAHIMHEVSVFHDPHDANDGVLELVYTEFDLMDLLPENKEMITYMGSLTTPPCFETVRWHVMKDTMTVTQEQLDAFRTMLESTDASDYMAPNWRPVQDMKERSIYHCQDVVDAQSVEKEEKMDGGNGAGTGGDMSDYYDEYRNWFIVGIAFICLFVISVGVIVYFAYLVYCQKGKDDCEADDEAGKRLTPKSRSAAPETEMATELYH